jgi:hypothetical protein
MLGCAGLLAFGLSMSSYAGSDPDTDGDGISDSNDNCVLVQNGPLGGSCSSNQDLDSPQDGYGHACDGDFNNDGAAGPDDLSTMLTAVIAVTPGGGTDLNCDGAAGPDDLSNELSQVIAVQAPGPSGLACAGTTPCP